MYSWSPNLSQISLKNSFGESGFSNFGRNQNDAKWKSVIWPPFWNGKNILYFFSWNMVVISIYTYGVKIIKKFRWESGFLWGGSMEPPLCTNGSAGYLMQLSVKLLYSAILSRSQRFYIPDTVHIIQCNLVAVANQRQLRHSNTQNKTYGLGSMYLSHDSFAQFSNEPWG